MKIPMTPVGGGAAPKTKTSLNFSTATGIIDAALQIAGLNPNERGLMPDGTTDTLSHFFWKMITSQNLTDTTTIDDMVNTTIPRTEQFQKAFPGYDEALKKGYVRTPADYVTASEAITASMMNWGVPQALINPKRVGDVIAGGVSPTELNERLQNGYAAVENAPAEVQSLFSKYFGARGPNALALLFMTPVDEGGESYTALTKMLGGAQVGGAAEAANLTVSQGLAQRLADMGETYASAQGHFRTITKQAGLYETTAGEANKPLVPGVGNFNEPLTASNQGVAAEFGLSAQAQQQVEQEALSRVNEFRGGGGATQTQQEGYQGLGPAKKF